MCHFFWRLCAPFFWNIENFIRVGIGERQACNILLLQCLMSFNHWSGDVTFCADGSLNCHIVSGRLSYDLLCDKFWFCPLKMLNDTDLWSPDWNWAHSYLLAFCFSLNWRNGWLFWRVLSAENASFLVHYIAYCFLLSFTMFKIKIITKYGGLLLSDARPAW
jgi:hypothetical protein